MHRAFRSSAVAIAVTWLLSGCALIRGLRTENGEEVAPVVEETPAAPTPANPAASTKPAPVPATPPVPTPASAPVPTPAPVTVEPPAPVRAAAPAPAAVAATEPVPATAAIPPAPIPRRESRRAAAAAPAAKPAPAALSDANIAAIVVAANNADILYADLALAKSRDVGVRNFAMMVKKDHQSVNEAATALVTRLKVTPVDNEISFDLRDDAETKRLIFRDLEGFAFDSAYAANEVSYHTTVLGAIDGALLPSARNAELRALIAQVRPAVAAHLEHAKALAAKKSVRTR